MSSTEFPTPLRRVITGAEFLDRHEPDWVDLIDTGVLDIALNDRCVLGQLGRHLDPACGDRQHLYQVAIDAYGLSVRDLLRFGFVGELGDVEVLTAGWLLVVGARQSMAQVEARYGDDEFVSVSAELVVA